MKNSKLFKSFFSFFNLKKVSPVKQICLYDKSKYYNTKYSIVSNYINKIGSFLYKKELKLKETIIKNVSGLYCPAPKERLLLSSTNDASNIKKTIVLQIVDYCYKLYGGEKEIKSWDAFIDSAENLLKFSKLNESPFSYPLNHPHNFYAYFPIKQHLFVSNFAGQKVPFKVLKNYFYKHSLSFDLEEYAKTTFTVGSILEYIVFFLHYGELLTQNSDIFCIGINSDKPFMSNIFRQHVFSIINQPNADLLMFRIIKKNIKDNEIQAIKVIPVDIKLKSDPEDRLALFKGYISITPTLNYKKYFKRFLGDLKGVNDQKKTKNIINQTENSLGKAWAKSLDDLLKSKLSLNEQKLKFNFYHQYYLLHPELRHLIPSKLIEAIRDYKFEHYYKIHKSSLDKIIIKYSPKIEEKTLFNSQDVDQEYIENLFLDILEDWAKFDPEFAKKMLKSYSNVKQLFILDDTI